MFEALPPGAGKAAFGPSPCRPSMSERAGVPGHPSEETAQSVNASLTRHGRGAVVRGWATQHQEIRHAGALAATRSPRRLRPTWQGDERLEGPHNPPGDRFGDVLDAPPVALDRLCPCWTNRDATGGHDVETRLIPKRDVAADETSRSRSPHARAGQRVRTHQRAADGGSRPAPLLVAERGQELDGSDRGVELAATSRRRGRNPLPRGAASRGRRRVERWAGLLSQPLRVSPAGVQPR